MTNGTQIADETITKKIEPFLVQATMMKLRCVDERPEKTSGEIQENGLKGVQFPGAWYGVIDAIKSLSACTEEAARQRAMDAHIPFSIHDDEHHGALGCGYGKLVQTEPETVMAPEAIDVASRFSFITSQPNHEVLTLVGDHHPIYATINYREGTTIDSPNAVAAGVGSFNYDYWAGITLGKQLSMDPKQFADKP